MMAVFLTVPRWLRLRMGLQSLFSLKRVVFQSIQPVVSQINAIFPLTFGRAALCGRLAFCLFQWQSAPENGSLAESGILYNFL